MSLPEGGRPLIPVRPGGGRRDDDHLIPPGTEERLAAVLERRATRPHIPGAGRWEQPIPEGVERMPADPRAAAAFNRTRLAAQLEAERTVAQQRAVVRRTETILLRQEAALRAAERRAAVLDPAPVAPAEDEALRALACPELPGWIREWSASGPALAEARKRYGLSQQRLADEAHFARSYVVELERETQRRGRGTGQSAKVADARLRLAITLARHVPLRPEAAAEGTPA